MLGAMKITLQQLFRFYIVYRVSKNIFGCDYLESFKSVGNV